MPKITKSGGPSHEGLDAPPTEGVASSPGTNSEASTPTQPTNSPKSESAHLRLVPTTEPLSNPDQTALDFADSTAGSTPETGTEQPPDLDIPKRNGSRSEWIEFAESVGLEGAANMTRDELVTWWDSKVSRLS